MTDIGASNASNKPSRNGSAPNLPQPASAIFRHSSTSSLTNTTTDDLTAHSAAPHPASPTPDCPKPDPRRLPKPSTGSAATKSINQAKSPSATTPTSTRLASAEPTPARQSSCSSPALRSGSSRRKPENSSATSPSTSTGPTNPPENQETPEPEGSEGSDVSRHHTVRTGGLEPPPPFGDQDLNLARMPIPPRPRGCRQATDLGGYPSLHDADP